MVGGFLKFLKFFFLDNDKKVNVFLLFVLKIEFFRIFRFVDKESIREEIKLWFGSYLMCIIVDIMSNILSIIINMWSRISVILSEDS